MNPTLQTLHEHKDALLQQLAAISEFRPGSLVARYRKCGRPTCHCAQEGDPGHGPSWSLTRYSEGKTVTKIIAPEHIDEAKEQIERYHQFQQVMHDYVETNVKLCDALLEDENSGREAEKGGSPQI
ncbi:MAG: hypothetical protein KGZ25_13690 [Planctomycetes bacterium]|nr:hypothetical protein [Planctomycetota bacterium]